MRDAMAVVRELDTFALAKGTQGIRTSTLNTFLASSLRDGDPEAAVAYMKRFVSAHAVQLSHISHGILFQLAWKCRCLNLLRVVWRYACVTGNVSWSMQERMTKSLMAYAPRYRRLPPGELSKDERGGETRGTDTDAAAGSAHLTSEGRLWFAWAARFAVGVLSGLPPSGSRATAATYPPSSTPLQQTGVVRAESGAPQSQKVDFKPPAFDTSEPSPSILERSPIVLASQHPLPPARGRSWRLAEIVKRDMAAVNGVHATTDFTELLGLAWQKDCEWKESGLCFGGSKQAPVFVEMLRCGIKVPIEFAKRTGRAPVKKPQSPSGAAVATSEGDRRVRSTRFLFDSTNVHTVPSA